MKERAKTTRPIHALVQDDDTFRLITLELRQNSDGEKWTRSTCTLSKINDYLNSKRRQKGAQDEQFFYLSCMILSRGELKHRYILKRITNPSSRNIKIDIDPAARYLQEALQEINPDQDTKKMSKKKSAIELIELEWMLNETFAPIKSRLGFPEINPYEFIYKITPEVKAEAKESKCLKYLDSLATRKYISIDEFNRICKRLENEHKADATRVIAVLTATKCRDHLAVISLNTENDSTYINLVNEHKHHVKMESRKFIELIERADKTLILHEFSYRRQDPSTEPFKFDNHKEGEVTGQFCPSSSCIGIHCSKGSEARGQALFVVDFTYTLCIYMTLKRLDEDKYRYMKLLEESTMPEAKKDPFDFINTPLF